MNYTEEEISRTYSALLDSVYMVNLLATKNTLSVDEEDTLKRNLQHLKFTRAETFWTTEDMSTVDSAILLGDSIVDVDAPTGTPEQTAAEIVRAVQRRLDNFAKERNYDSILSACTYATSTVPQFKSEGQRCVDLRDETWGRLYQIMAEVESGARPMPAGYTEIETDLPSLTWSI